MIAIDPSLIALRQTRFRDQSGRAVTADGAAFSLIHPMPPRPAPTLFRAIAPRCQATMRLSTIKPRRPLRQTAPRLRGERSLAAEPQQRSSLPPSSHSQRSRPADVVCPILHDAVVVNDHPSEKIFARRIKRSLSGRGGYRSLPSNSTTASPASQPRNSVAGGTADDNLASRTQKPIALMPTRRRRRPAAAATLPWCRHRECSPTWRRRHFAVQSRKPATGRAPNRRRRPWL